MRRPSLFVWLSMSAILVGEVNFISGTRGKYKSRRPPRGNLKHYQCLEYGRRVRFEVFKLSFDKVNN